MADLTSSPHCRSALGPLPALPPPSVTQSQCRCLSQGVQRFTSLAEPAGAFRPGTALGEIGGCR
jgi:hypothetical protein